MSFWVSPRRYPDFGWAWLTRFLLNLGNALGTLYLFFYLQDAVGYGDPGTGVLILVAIYSVFVVLTAVWSGNWSDRLGRRKIFVTWAGVVMAARRAGARGLADLERRDRRRDRSWASGSASTCRSTSRCSPRYCRAPATGPRTSA